MNRFLHRKFIDANAQDSSIRTQCTVKIKGRKWKSNQVAFCCATSWLGTFSISLSISYTRRWFFKCYFTVWFLAPFTALDFLHWDYILKWKRELAKSLMLARFRTRHTSSSQSSENSLKLNRQYAIEAEWRTERFSCGEC